MRAFLYILTSLMVIGLAFWAYRENYATQQALGDADRLHSDIREAHARLAVLRAEWAFQNRPERLSDLAVINFDRLNLLPLHPDQFGNVDEIAFPPPPPLAITGGIGVSTMDAPATEEDPL